MLGKKKNIKTFDDLELDSKPMPMAAECCLAEDVFVPTARRSSLLDELEDIRENYPDNWDGEGAKAINEIVYNNCVQIATECDTKILKNWHLDLDEKGYIVFSANDNNGSIRIVGNTMSYFLTKGKKHLMNKRVNYSVVAFSNLLKLWNYAKI